MAHEEEGGVAAVERDDLRGHVSPTCSWEQREFWDTNNAEDSCRKFGIKLGSYVLKGR